MALTRVTQIWFDKVRDRSKQAQWIYDLVFNPDGSQILAAAGHLILIYDPVEGELVDILKGHKDTVYCLSCECTERCTGVAEASGSNYDKKSKVTHVNNNPVWPKHTLSAGEQFCCSQPSLTCVACEAVT